MSIAIVLSVPYLLYKYYPPNYIYGLHKFIIKAHAIITCIIFLKKNLKFLYVPYSKFMSFVGRGMLLSLIPTHRETHISMPKCRRTPFSHPHFYPTHHSLFNHCIPLTITCHITTISSTLTLRLMTITKIMTQVD